MDEAAPVPDRTPRWRWPFTWLGLLAICWVVYELTHQPALGAVAICLKFGWQDFLTARWLLRNDPDRFRAHATSWLYFGWGLWKTALVAFLMSIAFALIAPRQIAPAPGAGRADLLLTFLSTFLTTLLGFTLATLSTSVAVLMAWRGRFRLWLDRAVHRARRDDYWPPSHLCIGRHNRLGQLLNTAVGLVSLVCLIVLLKLFEHVLGAWAAIPILLTPVVICLVRELVHERVWARHPVECWDDDFWPVASPPEDAVQ